MTVAATDVPNKFDCIINGEGYLFAPSDAGLPPSVFGVKPEFSYTPTFVTRQNTQGDYGDNQQDFWLTYTQRDWSLGEQQRYQGRDDDGKRRYWQGTNIDVSSQTGQASIRPLTAVTSAFEEAVQEMAANPATGEIYTSGTTKLFVIDASGTISITALHGLGTIPKAMTVAGSGTTNATMMSSTAAGTVGIRKWTVSAGFTTFSATGSDSLAYLNNALYGVTSPGGVLRRYDTAGTATTLYTWQDAAGATASADMKIIPFGGKAAILRTYSEFGSEIWIYDGTAPAIAGRFPNGFVATDIVEFDGSLFVGGLIKKRLSASSYVQPAVYYLTNGTTGLLWKASTFVVSTAAREPRLCAFGSGLVFTDDTRGAFMFYDPSLGGISTLGSYTTTDKKPRLTSGADFFLHSREATTPYRHPSDGYSTSATVTCSLSDFDSSLTKLIRGVKVEFDSATDGNGGTVDISYRIGDVDGSYTSLVTGATSGTEYTLSGVTGRSISVKVTLNKGTSTAGPVLKRISVRAAPQQTTFRQGKYVLFLGGARKREPNEGQMISLRDGTTHRKDGAAMAANIITAATSATPISVTDGPNGTVSSVVCDLANFQLAQIKPGEYVCVFPWREV